MTVGHRLRRLVTPVIDRIVYASTAYVDLKSMQNEQASELIDLGREPGGPAGERLARAGALLRPVTLPGRRLVRVGGAGDGGYVMLDEPLPSYALSIGVGPDVSWDVDVARQGVRVAMFDPTVRRPPAKVPNGTFYKVGIVGGPPMPGDFRSLDELLALAGFPVGEQMLLKIDVEGAEWGALSALGVDDLRGYRQICMELHDLRRLADASRAADVLAALELLRSTHLPVHVHANNYSPLVRFDRLWFPDAIEATFVRRDLAVGALAATRVSSPLDAPNDPRASDISLEGLLGSEVLPLS